MSEDKKEIDLLKREMRIYKDLLTYLDSIEIVGIGLPDRAKVDYVKGRVFDAKKYLENLFPKNSV